MSEKPSFYRGWNETESAANTDYQPTYPYNNVTQTRSGHMFELDDTKGRERVRLQHRANTFIEMHPNGDEVHKIYGDGYEIILGGKNVQINGQCNISIAGACVVNITGDSIMNIDGNFSYVSSEEFYSFKKHLSHIYYPNSKYPYYSRTLNKTSEIRKSKNSKISA